MPPGASVFRRESPWVFRTAARGGSLSAGGGLVLRLRIGDREVEDSVWVSPELPQEMLVGAGTMQKWDISIVNAGGRTEVVVGRDLHDPQTIEIDGTTPGAAAGAGLLQRRGA